MEVAQSTDSGRLPTGPGADEPQKKSDGELPALERIRQTAKAFDDAGKQQTTMTSDFTELAPKSLQKLDQAEVGNSTAVDRIASVMERMTRLSGPRGKAGYTDQDIEKDQSATSAKADATKRTPFESFSKEKYERYMIAAQGYMKQGRFYRAADAYALASLYRPDDPFAYAGRAHALFAAGEYVSSAIFLSRCLEISPDYLLQKVNLVGITGGPAIFEQRLTDLERCAKKADAPEMNLLLAYVYYRVGELDQARDAIDGAYKVLGNVPAVLAIKRAVEGIRPSGTK
jgi:tetratricopeptide (TPR) repeat protein